MSNESLSQRLRRNAGLKKYLSELESLTGRVVRSDELSDIDQAVATRQVAQRFRSQQPTSVDMPFSERLSERFAKFVRRLYEANPCPVSIWTPRTIDCGVFVVPSILSVRFDFDYSINDDGIFSFLSEGVDDRLVLDFFEENDGEQVLRVETNGVNWRDVAY
ncbi:MAG TPA: hypothetical protein VJ724_01635 [Tahibacter sp.]|nr:hypothetical protein [Tahibacter sp.]